MGRRPEAASLEASVQRSATRVPVHLGRRAAAIMWIFSHRRPHVKVHRRVEGAWMVIETTSGALQITADIVVDVDRLYRPANY
jgi:hypothetical protein